MRDDFIIPRVYTILWEIYTLYLCRSILPGFAAIFLGCIFCATVTLERSRWPRNRIEAVLPQCFGDWTATMKRFYVILFLFLAASANTMRWYCGYKTWRCIQFNACRTRRIAPGEVETLLCSVALTRKSSKTGPRWLYLYCTLPSS